MAPAAPDPLPRIGARVRLRRLAVADLPAFQAYRHDEPLGRYQGWLPQADVQAQAFLDEMSRASLLAPGAWVQLGIADCCDDVLIGDIGLCVSSTGDRAEIGFTLRTSWHGRGLASEAVLAAIQLVFEVTAVARIVGITDARNLAPIRLLERVGMRRASTRPAEFRGEACIEHVHELRRPTQLAAGSCEPYPEMRD